MGQHAKPAPSVRNLDAYFDSHELRDEMARKVADEVPDQRAYLIAYTILATDPNRYEDHVAEADLSAAVQDEVRGLLDQMGPAGL